MHELLSFEIVPLNNSLVIHHTKYLQFGRIMGNRIYDDWNLQKMQRIGCNHMWPATKLFS